MKLGVVDGETLLLSIQGPLKGACEHAWSRLFDNRLKNSKNILLNFINLTHMDSEGANLLTIYTSRLAQRRIGLAACHLSDPFRDIFRLTGLDQAIALFDDENEALSMRPFHSGIRTATADFHAYKGPLVSGWARNVEHISIGDVTAEAMNVNVNGRKVTSPVRGFGRLWDKKYRFQITGKDMDPKEIVSVWQAEFPQFWPKGNKVFTSGGALLAPGATALLNLSVGGMLVLASGIMVIYADENSFCFSSVQGHMLCGWITFSSFREDDNTIIQVHPLFRPADPIMEMGFRLGAARQEDQFWHQTLRNLAARLGVEGRIEQKNCLVDRRLQWSEFGNIWYCGAIRSSLYLPLYWLVRLFSSRKH
ncbi:MAG: STAS domain-containing protein [Deltaproteobacteria bacterium]|nr:STAS domain-containing protein [Deltaproteobacteria bacterium]